MWWREHPGALPAIDLAKCDLFVLDGDRHGGPDGRAALRELLRQQPGFDWRTAPTALTPGDGVHVYFLQNGHELGNARGKLPAGVDARGHGGFVVSCYSTLSDGRSYKAVPNTPDLINAFKSGTIPHVPQGIVDLIKVDEGTPDQGQTFDATAGVRERAWAQTALKGCMAELAGTGTGSRNEKLNAIAFRLGRLIGRGWLRRTAVEGALLGAMFANGAVDDDGLDAAKATLKSGIEDGIAKPHPDLTDRDKPEIDPETVAAKTAEPHTLDEVHATFRKWLGTDYDIGTLDAMLAVVASEKLLGDPAWLLVISGPGNAKTETVQATSGLGAHIVSTIASEGALLSATSHKDRSKAATGGLLRKIGDRGILVVKDFTSILSADRNTRASVLAALREVYDGQWVRNVGTDGGRTLTWSGRVVLIGACTTAWDQAHAVVAAMGDRFVLIRSDSSTGRVGAGRKAIRNTGTEKTMRQELSEAVAGLVGSVDPKKDYALTDEEVEHILQAADIVTLARTGVEIDYRGDIIDAHAPEMPTRFAKQLTQIMRGGLAIGMTRPEAMALVIRCARDSMPPLRLAILEDISEHPDSRTIDVRRRLQRPRTTADRALQALHVLGLLVCREEEEQRNDGPRFIRHYSLAPATHIGSLCVPDL